MHDIDDKTLIDATALANDIEKQFDGRETVAVVYALGMIIAHLIAASDRRDPDECFALLGKIADFELNRQFSN